MEKWGLGYDDISRVNPGVVMFSASMLGRGGPNDSQPGFGPVLTALAGHTNFTGWPDRVPVSPYGAYTDFLIPHIALAAIIAALDHRDATGKGQHLDLSQLEASLYFLSSPLMDYTANGRLTTRDGNRDPLMAPHNAYPCTGDDRWCAIACADDAQWGALASLMGQPALASDPRFATLDARKANEAALDAIVGAWTASQDANEVMRRCQEAGIAAGAVQDSRDLFADPQLQHREHFVFQDHPEIGRYASDGNCFIMSDATPEYGRAPLLGEHTHHVLSDILGMPPERIAALQQDGVLE
jgi:crotonobetainyl-CoA:carnitine CoA-transferase CaiB-like acyl-CoA transferase